MTHFYKKLLGVFMAICCLGAAPALATVSVLIEVTKTVVAAGEGNVVYVTLTNGTNASVTSMKVNVQLPANVTQGTATPASGTSYVAGTPGSTPGVWTVGTLTAGQSKELKINIVHNVGYEGAIITPTATIVTPSSAGVGLTSSIDILVGCLLLKWGETNQPVRIDNGGSNLVQFNNANTTYMQNFYTGGAITDTNPQILFNGFRKNENPPVGYSEYTATFQNISIANLGRVLEFRNAFPNSNPSGNNPYDMFSNPVTGNPPNYLEGKFTLDATTYPDGVNGISFFIYDIDGQPTNGWQDGVIVLGEDKDGNPVIPVTQRSAITAVTNVSNNPSINVGGLTGFTTDNPRGRVTYLFPDKIRNLTVRFFRNSQINSVHFVWLSSLYRGCGTDLQLSLDAPDALDCEQCFTYTVIAKNNGPSDVGLAQVTGILPAGLTLQSAVPSKGTFDAMTGKWQIPSLKVTDEETLVVEVCATQSLITFDMELLGDGEETDPDNNTVHKEVSVTYLDAKDDMAVTDIDTPVVIDWLANDISIGGTILVNTFTVLSSPHGTVALTATPGEIEFTPNAGFTGCAEVLYQVCDSNDCCDTAKMLIMIEMGPIAVDDYAATDPSTPVVIDVLANDIPGSYPLDPASVTIVTPPLNGMVTNINPESGAVTYEPNNGFCGIDTFEYQVCDTAPEPKCTTAQVTVKVYCPPTALNDAATTPMNTPVAIDVKTNDIPSDFPIDPTSVTQVSPPSNGSISINGMTGVITYTPNPFFVGTDSFVYQICDTHGLCDQATVYVTVAAVCKPCPTVCPPDCCKTECFCKVNECMCDAESFAEFAPKSGTWNQVADYTETSAPANTLNFLKYSSAIDQTYEELEVKISFPAVQPVNSQFTSAGLVTNWNGTDIGFNNQKVVYLSFDNNSGNPQNSKLAVGGLNTEAIFFLPFQIQYDTEYTVRIVKNQQQAYAFINNMYIGTSANGIVTGNCVGVWSYQASVQFSDLKSCSYREPLPVPVNQPFAILDFNMFPGSWEEPEVIEGLPL